LNSSDNLSLPATQTQTIALSGGESWTAFVQNQQQQLPSSSGGPYNLKFAENNCGVSNLLQPRMYPWMSQQVNCYLRIFTTINIF
jgi:hypothetical protein